MKRGLATFHCLLAIAVLWAAYWLGVITYAPPVSMPEGCRAWGPGE